MVLCAYRQGILKHIVKGAVLIGSLRNMVRQDFEDLREEPESLPRLPDCDC